VRRFLHRPLHDVGEALTLSAEASHHLCRVLRVRVGEPILLFDGEGLQAQAVVVDDAPGAAKVTLREAPRPCRPAHRVHLALGLLKGPAMDDAVRMATEAGMTDLHPVLARRSVATGDRIDRWERIAASAAQQCGRADVPTIRAPARLADVLRTLADVPARHIALPGADRAPQPHGDAAVLVGPEGGWTDDEVEHAIAAGFTPLGLGSWVLRAATAAPVAVAACSA
jgi:16S rRNA (uracil1498-N3)-methyltransferase